ncbi:MAG: fructosamine kinase family protein [Pseudomonadota bacterium]
MQLWQTVAGAISEATGETFRAARQQGVGGGSINSAYRVADGERSYFVKLNGADGLAMFEAEADGLRELAAAKAIKVPEPVATGLAGGQAFIVMEDLSLGGSGSSERFGRELAALHRTTQPRFGWHRDNTIGSTPQPNGWRGDWLDFWAERRLGFQLELAGRNGAPGGLVKKGERLRAGFAGLFDGYTPEASLLHGDLWSGNYSFSRMSTDGRYAGTPGESVPAIFDPAVYYGDREAEIAMTELFGGFDSDFYDAYNAAWPLDAGYPVRRDFYNLYHILNHFNLFGGGYAGQADRIIARLLAELG